jgi:hypothetical protein
MIDDDLLTVPLPMSREQLANLVRGNVERLTDDELGSWLPDVVDDIRSVEVGLWRCGCCDNPTLWESPFDWEPECGWCRRKALLVEVVGTFDYSLSV